MMLQMKFDNDRPVSEIFMFESVDARTGARKDGRTDAGSSPIL